MKTFLICLLIFPTCSAFAFQKAQNSNVQYVSDIQAWRVQRVASLRGENGWLNLAGLFRLQEGKNTFGSDPSNDLVFPKGARFLGSLILEDGAVQAEIAPDVLVYQGDSAVQKKEIFSQKEEPIGLQHQSLRWFVIQRGDHYYVRLRDLESSNLTRFRSMDNFPIDKRWCVEARLEPAATDFKLAVVDVIGTSSMQPSPGAFVFSIAGNEYRLYPTWEGEELFFVFGDDTNGDTTYGGGRFLYASKPDADGKITLDFNKAYNPPCAFTAFATCPLPAKQNRLPLEVKAGEKNYGGH